MSVYLSIVIKNDFHEYGNHQKEVEYAEKSLNLFRKALNSDEFKTVGQCVVEDFGDKEPVAVDMPLDGCEVLDAILLNGYWAFETSYDDYLFPSKDVNDNSFCVRKLAKFLSGILDQEEAWICVHHHASESCTAPTNFEDWLLYAETFGIQELDNKLMEQFTRENYGFESKYFQIGNEQHWLSYPIYHDNFNDIKNEEKISKESLVW